MEGYEMNRGEMNKRSVILHYASICANALKITDAEALADFEEERSQIESSLSMTKEEIILEANRLMNPIKQ
jgi:hypothetical protein